MSQVQAKVLDEALMTDELPNTFDNCEILLQDDLSILQYLSSGTPEVSLHAVAGQSNPRTLCIIGKIRSTNVQVVVDGGSTYNFIQERLPNSLVFRALLWNLFQYQDAGNTLYSYSSCSKKSRVEFHTPQNHFVCFTYSGCQDCPRSPMGGTLGPIITVYQHLSIQFFWNNQLV